MTSVMEMARRPSSDSMRWGTHSEKWETVALWSLYRNKPSKDSIVRGGVIVVEIQTWC